MITRVRACSLAVFLAAVFGAGAAAADTQPACDPAARTSLAPDQVAKIYAAHAAWVADNKLDIARKPSETLETRLDRVDLTPAQLADPRRAVLCGNAFVGANLRNQLWNGAILSGDTFAHSSIGGATFIDANLAGARFVGSDLRNVLKTIAALYPPTEFDPKIERWMRFDRANLEGAHFEFVALVHSTFIRSDLRNAVFSNSATSYMKFLDTDLTNTRFDNSDLMETVFEPNPDQLPNLGSLVTAKHLAEMTYKSNPAALLALRRALRDAGYEPQARMITHALRVRARELAWESHLSGKISAALQLVFFQFACDWGLAPWRPLLILIAGILVFAVPYFAALGAPARTDGIWRVWRADRLRRDRGTDAPELLKLGGSAAVRQALRFSLSTALPCGWLGRITPREYVLRASGWTRSVAAIQAMLSLYLILLWALCAFGHPFG